ncbi:MAG: OmpA family protein [Myxococcaceae bacterium]|nr:OmpA family protein [Myxococcaceae bacterium]
MTLHRAFLALALLGAGAAFAADKEKAGCKDYPVFPTRMPDYFLIDCQMREFDKFEFQTGKREKNRVEGKFTMLKYQIGEKKTQQSGLAITRNYENAIKQLGGTIAASDPDRWVNGSVKVDGKEIWVEVYKGNGFYTLNIIEKQAMEQHIVADAASLTADLARTGHVTVHGIFFDTGKTELKAESKAALDEVAKLLKADAALKLWVVGHTDSVGSVDDNMKLAQGRAEAVVSSLVSAHGIAAARLKGYGVGPLAPISSNDAEDGRGRNRRVELVKQP